MPNRYLFVKLGFFGNEEVIAMGKRSKHYKRQKDVISIKEIERRLKRDSILTPKKKTKDSPERNIRPGDVFMLQDDEFKNKYKESTNTKVIHYNRPCIVISVNKSTVNILAMTTKDRSDFDLIYPIMIEEGVVSNVIISQPLTVDFDRLKDYRGTVKDEILGDIKKTLSDYIICGTSYCKPKIPLFAMNTFRAIPYRVYKCIDTDKTFMLLKLKNRDGYIMVDIIPRDMSVDSPTIDIFCGKITFSHVLSATRLVNSNQELVCIGEECNKTIREKIYDKLNSIYGIVIDSTFKTDVRSSIVLSSLLLERLFEPHRYISAFEALQDILYSYQKRYLDAPDEYLAKVFPDIESWGNIRQIQNGIEKYLILNCDIFNCDTRILDIGKDKYEDIVESRLRDHDRGYILNDKGIVTAYTNTNQKYYLKNIRWMYTYHHPKKKK